MKSPMATLAGEIAGTREALEQTSSKERQIGGAKAALKQGFERAEREQHDRIWAGETTGNVVDDIIVATKGTLDTHAAEKFRSLMARFAAHRGQFVVGSHRSKRSVGRPVLVGIISSDMPTFCWNPPEYQKPCVRLPISLAVSFDSDWPHGYANITHDSWKIPIDREETHSGRLRCYDLEKLWEQDYYIHIGDEAVWKFLTKSGKHRYGPIVTFVHVASALGRPLAGVSSLRASAAPFADEVRLALPGLQEAHKALKKVQKKMAALEKQSLVGEAVEKITDSLEDTGEKIEAVKTFLKYFVESHKLEKK